MAHPYTAKQLNFFEHTLKILESALFDAELLASQAIALQEKPVESFAEIEEISDAKSSYFSILSEPVDASHSMAKPSIEKITEPTVVVTALPDAKSSAAFFQALPWENGSAENTTIIASNALMPTDNTHSVLMAEQNALLETIQNCSAFFQALPWQGQSITATTLLNSAVNLVTTTPAPVTPLLTDADSLNTSNNTCATFFQSLAWHGSTVNTPLVTNSSSNDAVCSSSTTALLPDELIAPEIVLPTTNNPVTNDTSSVFFKMLPWQGQHQFIDATAILAAMNSDDFNLIAGLATQTALSAAHRTNEQNDITAPPPIKRNTATGFFQALPW